jgi:hypothetical protein
MERTRCLRRPEESQSGEEEKTEPHSTPSPSHHLQISS